MSDEMPKSFKDGEFGFVPGVMLGGPIDGKRYRVPVLPNGNIPDGIGHPIQQPPETSPVAYYDRAGDATVGGYYVYFFRGTCDPRGAGVLADVEVIGPVRASVEQTCEGYGARPRTESRVAERGE